MKRSAHSKAVFDDSWITVDTTSLHRHKLYYCTCFARNYFKSLRNYVTFPGSNLYKREQALRN